MPEYQSVFSATSEDELSGDFSRQALFVGGNCFRKHFSEFRVQAAVITEIYYRRKWVELGVNGQVKFRDGAEYV